MTKYTVEDFALAARAEAEDRHPPTHRNVPMYSLADVREREAAAFLAGSEWARDHLAVQMPQVIIRHEEGKPSVCEVRQGGVLIFSGRDHSADLRVTAQEPTEVENPDPSVDYHAMWWKAECEREKAERERDKWHRAALTIQTERDAARNAWHEDREPTDAEREARWVVEHEHQFHGSRCLCGFETDRARTRTEHIMTHYFDEVRTARAARRDEEKR